MKTKLLFLLIALFFFKNNIVVSQSMNALSWKAGTYTGSICQGPLSLDIPDGTPVSLQCYTDEDYYFISGGDWIDDKWYAVLYDTWYMDCPLITIDTLTGDVDTIGNTIVGVSGFAYDNSADVAYGVTYGGDFCTIDLANGATTIIGSTGVFELIGLACSMDGQLYALSNDDNLYKIDKETGIASLVGPIGYDITSVYTGMSFDHNSNTLYAIATVSSSYLFQIDIETGAATEIDSYGDNTIASLAIPYNPTTIHDLGVVEANPANAVIGESIFPSVVVMNLGNVEENFYEVSLTINDGTNDVYSSIKAVSDVIATQSEMEIIMDDEWIPQTEINHTITVTVTLAGDSNLENNTISQICEVNIGIDDCISNSISLHPNPAKDMVFIESLQTVDVKIYNSIQQLLLEIVNVKSINTSSFENGVYVFRLETQDGNAIIKRVIISR